MHRIIIPSMTMARIVECRPEAAPLLERLGFDWCCGGQATLREECHRLGLDCAMVIRAIEADSEPAAAPGGGRVDGRLSAVCDQLETGQYGALQLLLARAIEVGGRVFAVHGSDRPALAGLERTLGMFAQHLRAHLAEMRGTLLPAIRRCEGAGGQCPEELRAGIAGASACHAAANRLLFEIRECTAALGAAPEACGSWRLLMRIVAELDAGVSACIRTERDVLFPMALGTGAEVGGPAA